MVSLSVSILATTLPSNSRILSLTLGTCNSSPSTEFSLHQFLIPKEETRFTLEPPLSY